MDSEDLQFDSNAVEEKGRKKEKKISHVGAATLPSI